MLYDAESVQGAALRDGGIVRMGTATTMYVRHMRATYRPDTVRGRRQTLEKFTRDLGNPALKGVKPRHVTDWLAAQPCGPSSTRTLLSHLRCFFRWAVTEAKVVKVDPTVGIKSPKQPRGVPRSLGLEDLRRLGAVLPDERAFLIVSLMLDLGLRRGEVSRLDIADLDMREETVRVDGKGGHVRLLPLTPTVKVALTRYLPVRGRMAGPLIRATIAPYGGLLPDTIGKLVSGWLREAGVKEDAFDGRSAHALRHSMAENLYRHEVDLRTIAAALGHSSPTTTWIYLRSTQSVEDLRRVMGQQHLDEPEQPEPVFQMPNVVTAPFPAYQIGTARPAMTGWAECG